MTAEDKKAKILAAAGTFGAHGDLYYKEARELESEGKIKLVATKTATGNTVFRWRLVA